MSLKDAIKTRVNIEDVCNHLGIALEKNGDELRALCPLHDEDTPSFYVNPEKGFYYCFGCGSGGDAITLVQETQGLGFNEALVTLAEWFGIDYDEKDVNARQPILKAATKIFEGNRERAYAYVSSRGISEGTATKFNLGFAQNGYAERLISLGYTTEEMQEIGLLSDSGKELFSGYVIIPLYSTAGMVVAISGRATKDQQPKYLTTRRTDVFDKRRFVFGANIAKDHIKTSKTAIVAEGQFDVMSLHEAGATNSVAILGSSATVQHMIALARMGAKRVISITDGDTAGIKATQMLFNSAKAVGLNPYTVVMEEGSDPNSILANKGGKYLANLLKSKAVSHGAFLVWLAQRHARTEGTTPEVELANLLTKINRYDPAFADAIQKAEEVLGVDKKEFKRFMSTRISSIERKQTERKALKKSNEAIAKALLKCPTNKAVDILREVYDSSVIQSIANTMPIEEGEACEEVIKIYNELKQRALMKKLASLKQRATGGDTDAIVEMVKVNAELQALKKPEI